MTARARATAGEKPGASGVGEDADLGGGESTAFGAMDGDGGCKLGGGEEGSGEGGEGLGLGGLGCGGAESTHVTRKTPISCSCLRRGVFGPYIRN